MAPEEKLSVVEAAGDRGDASRSFSISVEALKESRLVTYWQEEWKPLAVIVGVFLPATTFR